MAQVRFDQQILSILAFKWHVKYVKICVANFFVYLHICLFYSDYNRYNSYE